MTTPTSPTPTDPPFKPMPTNLSGQPTREELADAMKPDTPTDNPTADSDRPTPEPTYDSVAEMVHDTLGDEFADDLRDAIDRKNRGALLAWDQFRKHFTDPFGAAKGGVVGEMVELLRSIEWVEQVGDDGNLFGECPCCEEWIDVGHTKDCRLAAVLSQCKASGGQTKGDGDG